MYLEIYDTIKGIRSMDKREKERDGETEKQHPLLRAGQKKE